MKISYKLKSVFIFSLLGFLMMSCESFTNVLIENNINEEVSIKFYQPYSIYNFNNNMSASHLIRPFSYDSTTKSHHKVPYTVDS
jgi:hypothetical protein